MIADISGTSTPNSIPSYSASLAVDGILYFAANDGVHGNELWQTDGTPAATGLVADIIPGMGSSNPFPWPPSAASSCSSPMTASMARS